MKKSEFIRTFLPQAQLAGEGLGLNPVVILAQSAIESGWGQSLLATEHNNFFGLTAFGRTNVYWRGEYVELGRRRLRFRVYSLPEDSFMDYAVLIKSSYPVAAKKSFDIEAFANEIAGSPYISEVNGDDRTAYRKMIVSICKDIEDNYVLKSIN